MTDSAAAEDRLVTADELLRMPRGRVRRELIFGRIRELPFHTAAEGHVLALVGMFLGNHIKEYDLGEAYSAAGFQLSFDPDTVRASGITFVRRERLTGQRSDGYLVGAPDLAVETAVSDASAAEMAVKASEWLSAGCRMVVVVNPKRCTATVYRPHSDIVHLTERDVLDGGDVVPGWKLPLRELFD